MVSNPPWVTDILAAIYEELQDRLRDHPQWLPRLSETHPAKGRLVAELAEYGCGVYGCVLPTLDPHVVLKVTTDDTEADFARDYANSLDPQICVKYLANIPLRYTYKERQVTLLWREEASYVGQLSEYLEDRDRGSDIPYAEDLIAAQHDAAKQAYIAIVGGHPSDVITRMIRGWLNAAEAMARQTRVPELRSLGDGIVENYSTRGIVFGDVHAGNIGMVKRDGDARWVITDPGNIAIMQ